MPQLNIHVKCKFWTTSPFIGLRKEKWFRNTNKQLNKRISGTTLAPFTFISARSLGGGYDLRTHFGINFSRFIIFCLPFFALFRMLFVGLEQRGILCVQTTLNGKTKDSTINQTVSFSLCINLLGLAPDSFHCFSFLIGKWPSTIYKPDSGTIFRCARVNFALLPNEQMAIVSRETPLSVFGRIHIFNGMKYARRFQFSRHEAATAPTNLEPVVKTCGLNTFIYFIHNKYEYTVTTSISFGASQTRCGRRHRSLPKK